MTLLQLYWWNERAARIIDAEFNNAEFNNLEAMASTTTRMGSSATSRLVASCQSKGDVNDFLLNTSDEENLLTIQGTGDVEILLFDLAELLPFLIKTNLMLF